MRLVVILVSIILKSDVKHYFKKNYNPDVLAGSKFVHVDSTDFNIPTNPTIS